MVRDMKKSAFLVGMMFCILTGNTQVGLSGGISTIKAFGVPKPYTGIHLGVEIPRDDAVTFFLRGTGYFGNNSNDLYYTYVTARDFSTVPYQQQVNYTTKLNYSVIEGGTRYYWGDGYDAGFGLYGGSNMSVIFNSVKRNYDDYDEVKYEMADTELSKGSIFNIGVGLGGGVKNMFAGIGTLYFDMNFSYLILSLPSNNTASQVGDMYSPLLFNFALGFRKELY